MKSSKVETLLDVINHPLRRKVINQLESQQVVRFDDEDKETQIRMVHVHLPKLDEAGCIEYNHSDDPLKARRGPRWDDARKTLKKLYTRQTIQ